MPTVGWIQETVEDRYWERGGLADQYPPIPKIHYCPYCDNHYDTTGDLSTHISVDHPIERPVIFLGNRTALSEQTIRSPISKKEINFTIDINLPQRKLVDLGRAISRIVSAGFVLDMGASGFRKDLIDNCITTLRQDISNLMNSFNFNNDINSIEDYQEGSSWLQFC